MELKREVTVHEKLTKIGYRFSKKPPKGTFGLELETETKGSANEGPHPDAGYPEEFFTPSMTKPNTMDIPIPGWEAHIDNSLRNFGREFVFEKPLDFNDALEAIDLFEEKTKGIKFLKNAPACSTHVHVNMMNERPTTLAKFLTIYTLLENVLVEFSGEFRRANLFALPIRVAERTLEHLISIIDLLGSNDASRIDFNQQNAKYAAINVATLFSIGSVEIRSFRGETDMKVVKTWLTIINSILEYSRRADSPYSILCEYRDKRASLLEDIFFSKILKEVTEKVADIPMLIDLNLWSTYRLATRVKDWSVLNLLKTKNKKRVDLITQYAIHYGLGFDAAEQHTSGTSDEELEHIIQTWTAPAPGLVGNAVNFLHTDTLPIHSDDSSDEYLEDIESTETEEVDL
jgi:hypothetical protein